MRNLRRTPRKCTRNTRALTTLHSTLHSTTTYMSSVTIVTCALSTRALSSFCLGSAWPFQSNSRGKGTPPHLIQQNPRYNTFLGAKPHILPRRFRSQAPTRIAEYLPYNVGMQSGQNIEQMMQVRRLILSNNLGLWHCLEIQLPGHSGPDFSWV
jgi:hypothetical protein